MGKHFYLSRRAREKMAARVIIVAAIAVLAITMQGCGGSGGTTTKAAGTTKGSATSTTTATSTSKKTNPMEFALTEEVDMGLVGVALASIVGGVVGAAVTLAVTRRWRVNHDGYVGLLSA